MNTLGRPLEFKPEEALDAAIDVFWHQGYEATSITDLLEAMELSKSSLYQTFESKQELFEQCLVRYADKLATDMGNELEEASSGFSYVKTYFEAIADTAQQPEGLKGCLIGNTVTEFGQREPALTLPISECVQKISNVFVDAVIRGQADGSISAKTDPRALATYLHGVLIGMRTMIKAGMDRNSMKGMVTLLLKTLSE